MLRIGFIGWRGMVGSVLIGRMLEEKDFNDYEPFFFTTSNVGGIGPDVGFDIPPLKDAYDKAILSEKKYKHVLIAPNHAGFTPLHDVLKKGNLDNVIMYTNDVKAIFKGKDEYKNILIASSDEGFTSLHEVLKNGDDHIVNWYLSEIKEVCEEKEYKHVLIAANNAKKSAMTVTPDAEWLKQYLSTGEDQDNNLLTKEQYNDIIKNGITVIGDAGSFKNGLMKSAYMDPLQSYVEAGNTYTWNDPSGYGSWSVEKNNFGTSQYISTLNYKLYDPATGTMKEYRTSELGDYGNMLTTQRNNMMLHFKDVKSYNINAKNGR